MPQLGDSVPQLALLPTLGVTLQGRFQEVLLLLVRLIGQASEQHIDVGTGIQVGVFVAKPQQEFFILLTAFLLQRIDAEQQRRLAKSVPAIHVDDVLVTGHEMILPFILRKVAQTGLPNDIE